MGTPELVPRNVTCTVEVGQPSNLACSTLAPWVQQRHTGLPLGDGVARLFTFSLIGTVGAAVLVLQCSPAAAAELAMRQPQMRVLVAEGSVLSLRADGRQRLQVKGLGAGTKLLSRVRVLRRGWQLVVEAPELGSSRVVGSAGVTVQSQDPRGIWLGQRRYGGELRLKVRDGRLQAVNHLGVEAYLASVVGSEMPEEWPLAALQAQAVAARTYALRQRVRKGEFDVRATVTSQVYRGLESVTPRTRQAVNTTRSLVMVHGGKLINAVFHSSSGGATEPSGEVWRHQLPYLVSVRDHDHESPAHRWQQRFDRHQLQAAFRETGGLQALDVLKVSTTGRLRSVRVRGPRGAAVLSGRELRQRLGLKSTMVSFDWLAAGSSPDPIHHRGPSPGTRSGRGAGRDDAKQRDRDLLVGIWRNAATPKVDPGSVFAALPSIAPPPPPPSLPSSRPLSRPNSGFTSAQKTSRPGARGGSVLVVRGQGFGHGVGMSQWGARGLAEQGADFRQILEHYYRGVTIRPFLPVDDPAMAFSPQVRPAWTC